MAVNYGKIFGTAFRYAFSLKRTLPFFILNLMMVATVFFLIDYTIGILPLVESLSGSTFLNSSTVGIIFLALSFAVLMFVFALVRIFFVGVIVDDARHYPRKKLLSKSFPIVKKKYLSMVFATIIVGIISAIIGSVPTIGGLLGIIASWLFLFIIPFIIISNKSAVESLKSSYRLFMKNKADVLIFWLLLTLIGFAMLVVSLIPIIVSAYPIILESYQLYVQGITDFTTIIALVKGNLSYLLVGSVIASVVFSYMTVFQESAKTFFFLQKKRR